MTHLLCKIYPRDKSFIGGVLPNNKRIEAPTEASLNPKEYDLCRKQATITVNINAGEKDVSTLSFADALKLAIQNAVEKAEMVNSKEVELLRVEETNNYWCGASKYERLGENINLDDIKISIYANVNAEFLTK